MNRPQLPMTEWVLLIMSEIDTLSFGDGFAHMTDGTEMYFGTAHIVGVEAIKAFFVKIDQPLNIAHDVLEFWTAPGGVCLLRGETITARKRLLEVSRGRVGGCPFWVILVW